MAKYIIYGGKKLKGEITVNPSKNGALAVLIASLLNEKITVIKNLPRIEEVFRVIEVLRSIGVKTEWNKNIFKIIPPKKFTLSKIDKKAASKRA